MRQTKTLLGTDNLTHDELISVLRHYFQIIRLTPDQLADMWGEEDRHSEVYVLQLDPDTGCNAFVEFKGSTPLVHGFCDMVADYPTIFAKLAMVMPRQTAWTEDGDASIYMHRIGMPWSEVTEQDVIARLNHHPDLTLGHKVEQTMLDLPFRKD
jgi:hypothetical protein